MKMTRFIENHIDKRLTLALRWSCISPELLEACAMEANFTRWTPLSLTEIAPRRLAQFHLLPLRADFFLSPHHRFLTSFRSTAAAAATETRVAPYFNADLPLPLGAF